MQDQRHSTRLPINISLKIESLYRQDHDILEDINESIVVQNISKTGIGFEASHELPLNYYFNAHITIDDEKHFFGVLKIIRKETVEKRFFYGCEFVGLASVLSSYIDDYQKEIEEDANNI
jgi:hypothetical protein